MRDIGLYYIGVDGEKTVDSRETATQIEAVRRLDCGLTHKGEQLTWDIFDNPEEVKTLFQTILADRRTRVDEGQVMADRPMFAVVTAVEGRAVRLEYYEGHDALSLTYDVRCQEFQGIEMENWLDADPQAYNPVRFLEDVFDEGSPQIVDEE